AFSFKFSARPGTPAAALPGQVAEESKDERLQRLQALLRDQAEAFNREVLGRVVPVLVEKPGRHQGQVVGRSPWLHSVHCHAPGAAIGETIDVRLLRLGPNSIAGEVAAPASGEAA
ncbi:MAG: TRAM domain-containing protein, partial [Alphaproteobacteria bacterium]